MCQTPRFEEVESVPRSLWHAANGKPSSGLKAELSPCEQFGATVDRLASEEESGKSRKHVPLLESRFVTPDQVVKAQLGARALAAAVVRSEADLASAEASLVSAIADEGEVGSVNALRVAAQVRVENARLFLDYCTVRSPINGYITNLNIAPGEYANEGQQVFAIVEDSIWYVMAYFKETYLSFLEIGDTVEVYLMARPTKRLLGKIQGIGWALHQANGATNVSTQLPDVAPTLDWVRLAQRFPVRVVIEDTAGEALRMGETAAVIVLPGEDSLPRPRFEVIRTFFDWLGINH